MAATTDLTEFFKYTYFAEDRLTYIASQEVVLYNILKRSNKPIGGRGLAIMPFQTRNTGVFQGHSEGGALTTRRAQPETQEAVFALQEFHGIYDVTWKALRAASRSEWAFERMVEFLDTSMTRRVLRLLNAELIGTGLGELAVLPSGDDGPTITVDALPLVDEGMIVDVMDKTDNDTLLGDGLTVTAIDVQNRTVTLSAGITPSASAAGDYLTVADTVSNSGSLHMIGITAWVDNGNPDAEVGNIGGIDRTAAGNEFFQANVLSNSGTNRPFTEDLGIQGSDLVRERGGDKISDYISNLRIIRRYHADIRAETIASLGRVGPVSGGLGREEGSMQAGPDSTGGTPYTLNATPWHAEPFYRANTMLGISRRHFVIAHDGNQVPMPIGDIFDVDMFKRTSNASFDVDHYWEAELLCDMPSAQVKFEDIAEA